MFRSKRNTPPPFKPKVEDEHEKLRKQVEADLCRIDPDYKAFKEREAYQNKLFKRLAKAEEKYEQDGDVNALIKEYEYLFITADPPCSTSQNMKLLKRYLETGQRDKAWGYLNRLLMTGEAPLGRIRYEQAKMLYQEKKYADSILMHMLESLASSEYNRKLDKEHFFRRTKAAAKKLKWDETVMNDLASILETHIKNDNFYAGSLVTAYRNYYNYITKQ